MVQRPLLPGRLTSGSTRGISSHEAHPWFAVRPRGDRDEHHGPVWFGSLAWSGNWLGVFDVERNDALNVVIGISDRLDQLAKDAMRFNSALSGVLVLLTCANLSLAAVCS